MREFWTDGSAVPNPGAGGFAVIEVINGVGEPVCLGRGEDTTNIKMEGEAIAAALEYAGGERCLIYTDSEFWVNVLTKWAVGWESKGWQKSSGGKIQNLKLVKRAYYLYRQSEAELVWTRGHVGTEFNEMADTWANKARLGAELGGGGILP